MKSKINHHVFIANTVSMATNNGYRVTPVYKHGLTRPYKNGQTYPDPTDHVWKNAIHVAIVLDEAILIDYDANKAKADRRSIITIHELAELLEIYVMPQPIQTNVECDSLHFLFRFPKDIDRSLYKQSTTSGLAQYIDVKTGNQLMHIKAHKIINVGAFPNINDLPIAPQALLDHLYKGDSQLSLSFEGASWNGELYEVEAARKILTFIPPEEDYDPWLHVLMAIYDKFGCTQAALELCDEWSARAENYCGPEYIWEKLCSFDSYTGQRKSFGALCRRAEENGANLSEINKSSQRGQVPW